MRDAVCTRPRHTVLHDQCQVDMSAAIRKDTAAQCDVEHHRRKHNLAALGYCTVAFPLRTNLPGARTLLRAARPECLYSAAAPGTPVVLRANSFPR